jgi:hypothetical protein
VTVIGRQRKGVRRAARLETHSDRSFRCQFGIAKASTALGGCHVGLARPSAAPPRIHIRSQGKRMARAVLPRRSMCFRRTLVLTLNLALAGTLTSAVGRAQTTTTTGPSISASGQQFPLRLTSTGASACGSGTPTGDCTSTRPRNLNPQGISYADCISDMVLQFSVTLSGFTGLDSVEVWASLTSDCTAPADRGSGSSAAVCWGLRGAGPEPGLNAVTPVTPGPLSEANRAPAPWPPEGLVAARQDRVHIEKGKLIAALPLKVSKPK